MTATWPTVELAKLATILSGFAFDSTKFSDDAGIPLVRIRDVSRGSTDTYFNGDYDFKFIVNDGDLLVGMDGRFNRELWRGGRALLNQRVCRITADGNNLDQRYLYHFLPRALSRIEDKTPFATVKHLSTPKVRSIQVPLPPLEEQRRIAYILDQAVALRTKRQSALVKLDALRDSIAEQEFRQYQTRESLGDHLMFVTSGSRGWAKYYADRGSRFIRSQDVLLGSIEDSDPAFVDPPDNKESMRTVIRPGDLLITITGTVGRAAAAPIELNGAFISQHVAIARPSPALRSRFVESFLCSREGQSQLERAQYGQTKPGLNLSQIREFKLPVPGLAAQDDIVRRLQGVDCCRKQLRRSEKALDSLFASLQHRAFHGEL
jgi:type I restriction enzyme S subunit